MPLPSSWAPTFMNSAAFPSEVSGLLTFATAYAAMLVTPGPSFAVVSQASLSASRREAALVVVGIAFGASLLIMLVLSGAANLPTYGQSEQLGRYAGPVLLLVIGFRSLRRSLLPIAPGKSRLQKGSSGGHFVIGLVTAITNPISFAFFSSVALASRSIDTMMLERLLPLGVFLMALCWFGLLAMLLTLPLVKTIYTRSARQLDGIMGAVLIGIAVSWLLKAA